MCRLASCAPRERACARPRAVSATGPDGSLLSTLAALAVDSPWRAKTYNRSGTPSSASGAAGSGAALKTATINGVSVVTNAQGFTLYSFAPDTATASNCTRACAQIWPPVTGPAAAGQGVTGTLGTITRPDGSKQVTYNGHPLYTYTADTAAGQAKGNGINVDGGVWHEVTASGQAAPAACTSPSAGGGYGY